MTHIDEPQYNDEFASGGSGTGRGRGTRRRATSPARPAWDAATYGAPDDTRRARLESPPAVSEWSPRRYPPAPEAPYPDSYGAASEPYVLTPGPYGPAADSYAPDSYEPDSYAPDPYAPDPYAPDPYAPDPYARTVEGPPSAVPAPPPASRPDASRSAARAPAGRAGRNLPAAILTGTLLGAAVLVSLFVWRPLFLGLLTLIVVGGIWELTRSVRAIGANPPLIPLAAGGVSMVALSWWGDVQALAFGLVVTLVAAMLWRLADRPGDGGGDFGRDIAASALVAVYVPFLAGFANLLAVSSDGQWRVMVTLVTVVLSDTGGYVAGVLFGRHRMAPRVSPKKSWEGLFGSLLAAAVGAAVMLRVVFDVTLWQGALFGIAIAIVAVIGDLGESMIKRDLGVKDMSRLLPGHGGVMDRLDSILPAAPAAYVLLVLLAPPG